jgi:antitoxin (DNA-binding transcriptional repressor) of toxin-antitoxin stability system
VLQIRPVSDLRNKFSEIEVAVSGGDPIFLTKNGYGSITQTPMSYSMPEKPLG